MKKIFYFLFIAGSLILGSCVKETSKADALATRKIEFNATAPDSKAIFGEKTTDGYPVTWTSNDVAPAVIYNKVTTIGQASEFTPSGATARFVCEIPGGAESYTFTAVSPFSSLRSVYDGKRLNVEIPSAQTCSSTSPDENAIILYAKTVEYAASELPSSIDLTFDHITAYLHLSFTNLAIGAGETVQSVSIESANLMIAGRMFFYTDNQNTDNNSMVGAISVTTDQIHDVWVALAPVDLSGENVSFIIQTDSKTYTKSVTFPANRSLSSGRVAKLTVDMTGIEGTSPVEYRLVSDEGQLSVNDEIIIVAANFDYAMSTAQNANNRGYTGITKDENSIWSPSSAVQRITLVDGIVPGEYALKTGDDAYLRFESGGNHLRTGNTIDTNSSWYIDIDNTTDTRDGVTAAQNIAFIQEKTDGRFIRFNSNLFSAYVQSSGTSYVRIYRKVQDPDTTPRFNVTGEDGTLDPISVTYSTQSVPIYIFGNVAWTASVSGDGASLSASSGTGNAILTLSIPINTSWTDALSYSVTVSTTASVTPASYSLTVNQAAVPAITVNDVLWSENWAGCTANKSQVSDYAKTGTFVYGGATVNYSSGNGTGTTQIYTNDATIYCDLHTSGSTSTKYDNNLMISKGEGYFKVAGLPCPGVKKAKVQFDCNRSSDSDYYVTTDTDNVTIGSMSKTSYQVQNGSSKKDVYVYSCEITFPDDNSIKEFSLQFNDKHTTNNIRVSGFELVATEVF